MEMAESMHNTSNLYSVRRVIYNTSNLYSVRRVIYNTSNLYSVRRVIYNTPYLYSVRRVIYNTSNPTFAQTHVGIPRAMAESMMQKACRTQNPCCRRRAVRRIHAAEGVPYADSMLQKACRTQNPCCREGVPYAESMLHRACCTQTCCMHPLLPEKGQLLHSQARGSLALSFGVSTQFRMATVRGVDARDECHWSHAWKSFKCKTPSDNAHRTEPKVGLTLPRRNSG
jgi:hypothetical protein